MLKTVHPIRRSLKRLYAKDKIGRIKEWEVEAISHPNGTAEFIVTHGLQGGKKTSSPKLIETGKNIGKANETTPYEQALSEAQSRWNKQIDKGYRQSVAEIKEDHEVEFFLPMLAERFDKRGGKMTWPAWAQPKLDGFRCLARKRNDKVTLWSRKGKIFDVPKEIIADLEDTLENEECLDGELYMHEWRNPSNENDFQRISSAVKKYRPDTALLQYHVYDRPIKDVGFEERFVNATIKETERIRKVETIGVDSEKEMMKAYEKWISQDLPYEGLMVRARKGHYMFAHRSNGLLKVKPLNDAEFKIIGGQEATGLDAGTVVFKCVTDGGEEFDVRPIGTREQRKEYYDNLDNYVGQWLTVEFNGWANSGKPRFPRGTKLRPEWDLDLSEKTKKKVIKKKPAAAGKLPASFNPFAPAKKEVGKLEPKNKGMFNPFK